MTVRNFYVEGNVDGRKTRISGGPSRVDGGMWLRLTQRSHGEIEKLLTVRCYVRSDGALVTEIWEHHPERPGDTLVLQRETER